MTFVKHAANSWYTIKSSRKGCFKGKGREVLSLSKNTRPLNASPRAGMASARVELRALVDEVRRGCVRYPSRLIEEASPRSRLLRQLAEVEVSLSGSQHVSQHQIEAAPPEERFRLLASKQLDCRLRKCRRVGACLACTLRPCLCPQLPPLRLGHRRERSRLEHPRSRGTLRASSTATSSDAAPSLGVCALLGGSVAAMHPNPGPSPSPTPTLTLTLTLTLPTDH